MINKFKGDMDLVGQLLLEQYKQTAEEYRAEYLFTWQLFAIIVALNGTLFGLLKYENPIFFNKPLFLPGIIGLISSYIGIHVINRSKLYQKFRLSIAEEIQQLTSFDLYSNKPIEERLENRLPDEDIKFYDRLDSRIMMQFLLALIGFGWLVLWVIEANKFLI